MKRLILLVIIIGFISCLTVCAKFDTKILVCNGSNSGNNMIAQSKVKYIFKNNKL